MYIYVVRIMKRKFKQGCSSIPSISTKQPNIPHLNKLNTPKKITAYDIGNLGPGVGHVQLCAGDKPVNGIPTLPGVKPVNGIPTLPWDQLSPLDN